MIRARRVVGSACLALLALAPAAGAQQMESYHSKEFNIQFQLPEQWETTTDADADVPSLTSVSPDESVVLTVLAYEDSTISTEDLLDFAVDQLDMDLDGEASQEEINGLDAWVAEATGKIDDVPVGMFIMAATYGENNYIAYVFTEESRFDANAKVMNRILDSFAPLEE